MQDEYWKLVEPIWDEVSISEGAEKFLGDFEKVPERAGVLLAAHWTQSEFMNGGLGQFFSNPTGVLAPEAVVAFIALGMPETAAILSEAMLFFGVPYPRDRKTRQQVVERFYEEQGEDGNPIGEQEELFGERIEEENGGFWEAADRYAANGEQGGGGNSAALRASP